MLGDVFGSVPTVGHKLQHSISQFNGDVVMVQFFFQICQMIIEFLMVLFQSGEEKGHVSEHVTINN